jgi:hypothetical protein
VNLIEKINAINGVNANVWKNHGKSRIYIDLTKSQNRFPAYSGRIFVENGELIIQSQAGIRENTIRKSECAGAKTYRENIEIIKKIKNLL